MFTKVKCFHLIEEKRRYLLRVEFNLVKDGKVSQISESSNWQYLFFQRKIQEQFMCCIFTTKRTCQRLLESSDNQKMSFSGKGFIPFSWQQCNLPSYPNYVTPKIDQCRCVWGGGGGHICNFLFQTQRLLSARRLTQKIRYTTICMNN